MAPAPERAFVVAHYDAQGRIRRNLRALIEALAAMPGRVVFVSTGATSAQVASLPPAVQAIVRPNEGYDFTSYRAGIEALGDPAGLDQLTLLNSSFACLDPGKLCAAVTAMGTSDVDVAGLTASGEEAFHVQSYFLSFCNRRILASEAFRRFWAAVEPISERPGVIGTYEVGLSRHFAEAGARLATGLTIDATMRMRALCRWYEAHDPPAGLIQGERATLDLRAADALNPTHFLWDYVLARFGIVKLELLQRNPYRLNLHALDELRRAQPLVDALLEDALAG